MKFNIPHISEIGKRGSNQYSHRPKFIKKNTAISVAIIITIVIILLGLVMVCKAYDSELLNIGSSLEIKPVYGAYNGKYKAPELATVPEREQNIGIIKQVWGKDAWIGLAIARAESGYRTKAVHYNTNSTIDQGVFQVNSVHNMPDMLDPIANISYAYTLYLKEGTNPWLSSYQGWKGAL